VLPGQVSSTSSERPAARAVDRVDQQRGERGRALGELVGADLPNRRAHPPFAVRPPRALPGVMLNCDLKARVKAASEP
jgi:hypothetical protein